MLACRISKLNFAPNVKYSIRNYSFSVKSFIKKPKFISRNAKKYICFIQNFNLPISNILRTFTTSKSIYFSELEEFNAVGKIIHDDLIDCNDKALPDVMNWYSKALKYNLKNGKKIRSMFVLQSYKTLANRPTADGLLSASILGSCLEMLDTFFLIADDIMDQSTTRRGECCWHRKRGVGLNAINDAFMLQSGIYKILRKHFVNSTFYLDVVHDFEQCIEKTIHGHCLDMLSNSIAEDPFYDKFTLDNYNTIAEYKTAHFTFCSPVRLGMHLAGERTNEEYQIVHELGVKLGRLYQIQDDYLDIYEVPEMTGKSTAVRIVDGKCTWFAVTFLENAANPMRQRFMENYGKPGESHVSEVLLLYEKLNLKEKFESFENKLYAEIESIIKNDLTNKPIQELFFFILNLLFKRRK